MASTPEKETLTFHLVQSRIVGPGNLELKYEGEDKQIHIGCILNTMGEFTVKVDGDSSAPHVEVAEFKATIVGLSESRDVVPSFNAFSDCPKRMEDGRRRFPCRFSFNPMTVLPPFKEKIPGEGCSLPIEHTLVQLSRNFKITLHVRGDPSVEVDDTIVLEMNPYLKPREVPPGVWIP